MGTLVYLICIAVASFAVLAHPAVAQGANITLPLIYPGQVLQGDGSQTCPSEEQRRVARSEIKNDTRSLFQQSVVPLLQTQVPTEPPTQPTTQPTTQPPTVTRFSCGGSTGWRRVANLNMSNPSQQCPSVWQEINTPHRVCRSRSLGASCEGLNYSTGSQQYDQVCGRIFSYQIGAPEAFFRSSRSINSLYVEGVSVTHGNPRQHIWTFANGLDEQGIYRPHNHQYYVSICPCVIGSTDGSYIPSFVGQNYFCESGIAQWNGTESSGVLWPNGDPLWDGQGCGPTSSCCAFNSPPWFSVTLPSPTSDDIEVRICSDEGVGSGSPIQLIELYVK